MLVCDAIPAIRNGVRNMLEAEPDLEVVATTGDGGEAVTLARRLRPEVVVTDIDVHGISGFDVATHLTSTTDDHVIQVLVFTTRVDDATIMRALAAGAYGYLVKDSDSGDLARAVRALAAGQATLSAPIARRLIDWLFWRNAQPLNSARRALERLTRRELEIMRLVAHGMSNEEIADKLCLELATVRSHTYHLRHKLDLRDRAQIVSFAYQSGLTVPIVPESPPEGD